MKIEDLKTILTNGKRLEMETSTNTWEEVPGLTKINPNNSSSSEEYSPYELEGASTYDKVGITYTYDFEGLMVEDSTVQNKLIDMMESTGAACKGNFRYTESNGTKKVFRAAVEGIYDQGENKKMATFSGTLHVIGRPEKETTEVTG